jgi:hypothetical protein
MAPPKSIVKAPPREERYRQRLGFKGVNVINGAAPTGRLPKVIGSGIFGYEGEDNGIFSGDTEPPSNTGIFFDDYARYDYEVAAPDMQWNLLRRPGRPLYPGSSSYGIVLEGPSMGTTEAPAQQGTTFGAKLFWLGAGAAVALGIQMLIKKHREEE